MSNIIDRNNNLEILKRLSEMCKNVFSYDYNINKDYKKEYIFLSNILNTASDVLEREFQYELQRVLNTYNQTLSIHGIGYFDVERLIHLHTQINQLSYIIYGSEQSNLVFKKELGDLAYKDLLDQIDVTLLMSFEEKIKYNNKIESIVRDMFNDEETQNK